MSKSVREITSAGESGSGVISPPQARNLPLTRALPAVLRRTAVWVALVDLGLMIIFGALSPNWVFLGITSLQNIALNASQIVVLSCAAAFELAAGEIDISLGASLVLSSIFGGEVMTNLAGSTVQVSNGYYPHLALALAVGIVVVFVSGALFGLINGLIVTRLGVNSFIATLATSGAAAGVGHIVTNGSDLPYIPPQLQSSFGANLVLGIPAPAVVVFAIAVALWAVLTFTRFGLHTLSLGSSRQAAERAGIRVQRHVIAVFMLAGLLSGFAGLLDISRFATTNIAGHTTDALAAVAGAVIGGTSLFGGRASIVGAVLGALLAVILETGLIAAGFTPFYQEIAVGVVLVIAVVLDRQRKERAR